LLENVYNYELGYFQKTEDTDRAGFIRRFAGSIYTSRLSSKNDFNPKKQNLKNNKQKRAEWNANIKSHL
jgi:hypothetical protein